MDNIRLPFLIVGQDPFFLINLSKDIADFGFYDTVIYDRDGQLTLNFTTKNGIAQTLYLIRLNQHDNSAMPSISELRTDDLFSKVRFINTGERDGFGFDDFTIGIIHQINSNPVPESSKITMLLFGLTAMVYVTLNTRKGI